MSSIFDRRISGKLQVKKRGNRLSIEAALSGSVFLEEKIWVAHCRELDLSSCGTTKEEALENISRAINLFFDSCVKRGTLRKALNELGWVCETPEHDFVDCEEYPFPRVKMPAFMIDNLQRQGNDWSTRISFGM